MFKILLSFMLLASLLEAKDLIDPAVIFQKKCQMCHNPDAPQTLKERDAMVAPFMTLAMKSLTVGMDALESPKNNKELRKLTIEHIEDYIFYPNEDKSFCEEIIFERFKYMPSLERFISPQEAKIVAPWIYDTFAPEKYQIK